MGSKQQLIYKTLKGVRNPGSADFVELVRNCDRSSDVQKSTGRADSARQEALRFGQRPTLTSNEHTVADITSQNVGNARALIEVYSPGLCGVDGPMPFDITGLVISQSRNNYDYALQRFLDIINHRFISFYYRAIAQNSTAISFDDEKEDLVRLVQHSLSGGDGCGSLSLPPFTAEGAAAFTMTGAMSASGLEMLLHSYFGIDIKVETNVFGKYPIPKNLRCRLGQRNTATLGVNSQLGTHFFSNTKTFILTLGPLDFDKCAELLPGTQKYCRLSELVKFYLRKPIYFDLKFILNKKSLKGITLNGKYALGHSTFFKYRDESGTCTLTIQASRVGN